MDPDLALVAGVLAAVGWLRRRVSPGAPTTGRQAAGQGRALSAAGAGMVRSLGNAAAAASIGAGETVLLSAGMLADRGARAAAALTVEATSQVTGLVGRAAAEAAGLVVDGVGGVTSAATAPLRAASRRGRPVTAPLRGGGRRGRPTSGTEGTASDGRGSSTSASDGRRAASRRAAPSASDGSGRRRQRRPSQANR
jgi:hypothetical protein